jgi:hypothetical protein
MDLYLVQHVHIIKVMPKLECKNYNINLIKILKLYLEILACSVYRRWMMCWKDIIIKKKALRIKLNIMHLK